MSSSEDSSDSSNLTSTEEEDDENSDSSRHISGDKSEEDEEEDGPDAKDQFLLPEFKPKVVCSFVSKWARKNVRRQLLGLPIGREERKKLVDKYWCPPGIVF